MTETCLEMILVKDYLKYEKYANANGDMAYLNSKGIHLINYIEILFDRLFKEDIDEYIEKNNLRS